MQALVCCSLESSENNFQRELLEKTVKQTEPDEVTVVDAGFAISELQRAKVKRWAVRMANN